MNLLKNKKHTEIRKETAPLKMKRGQKKLFALYAVMVLSICIGATCVYAAGDPLTVVNNLSTFIFSLNKRKADGIYPGTLMRCMAYLRSLSANLQRYPMDESDQSNSKY